MLVLVIVFIGLLVAAFIAASVLWMLHHRNAVRLEMERARAEAKAAKAEAKGATVAAEDAASAQRELEAQLDDRLQSVDRRTLDVHAKLNILDEQFRTLMVWSETVQAEEAAAAEAAADQWCVGKTCVSQDELIKIKGLLQQAQQQPQQQQV
jgi:hypothetical protein